MPATAGRVPMPQGNRVTTSSSLKVSDRWTALVGSDPYASNEKPTDNMMQKMWADPRLHGNQKKIGSNDDGSAIFAATGEDKRAARKMDGLQAREEEFERQQARKRAAAQAVDGKEEGLDAKRRKKEKKDKKEKKEKKDKKKKEKEKRRKKEKKAKKEKKEKKEKDKKRKRDDSSDESGSDSGSESGSGSDSE